MVFPLCTVNVRVHHIHSTSTYDHRARACLSFPSCYIEDSEEGEDSEEEDSVEEELELDNYGSYRPPHALHLSTTGL